MVTTHINAGDVSGKTITNAYDALGRLVSVTDWQGQQTQYGYDALNRLTGVQLTNGVIGVYTYNSAGRLVGVVYSKDANTLASYQYVYDPNGNRLQATENILWVNTGAFVPPPQFSAIEQGFLSITLAWPGTPHQLLVSPDGS